MVCKLSCANSTWFIVPGRCIKETAGHHHRRKLVDVIPEDGDFKDHDVQLEELEYADITHLKSIVPCEIEPPCSDFALDAVGVGLRIHAKLDRPCLVANS